MSKNETDKEQPKYRNKDWLREKYVNENLTITEMSDLFGYRTNTIRKYLYKYGFKDKNTNGDVNRYENEDWLRQKYSKEKLSSNRIAEMCGVSGSTIRRYLKLFNIETRTKGTESADANSIQERDQTSVEDEELVGIFEQNE
jgi:hypothetical protein